MVRQLSNKPVLVMDVFEGKAKGQDIEGELGKYLSVIRQNLTPIGLADYFWMGVDSTRYTQEHKTAGEFLQTMGNRLDVQLRKHTQHADDVGLIIEGIIHPTPDGKSCFVWTPARSNSKIMVQGHRSPHSYQEVMGYIWGLEHMGISVYTVPDWKTMCRALAEFVYNSLKSEHKTLKRYVKSKPIILDEKLSVKERGYVTTLIGLSGARIAEVTAKRILSMHGTPFRFFLSELGENPDINQTVFVAAMKAIGRNV